MFSSKTNTRILLLFSALLGSSDLPTVSAYTEDLTLSTLSLNVCWECMAIQGKFELFWNKRAKKVAGDCVQTFRDTKGVFTCHDNLVDQAAEQVKAKKPAFVTLVEGGKGLANEIFARAGQKYGVSQKCGLTGWCGTGDQAVLAWDREVSTPRAISKVHHFEKKPYRWGDRPFIIGLFKLNLDHISGVSEDKYVLVISAHAPHHRFPSKEMKDGTHFSARKIDSYLHTDMAQAYTSLRDEQIAAVILQGDLNTRVKSGDLQVELPSSKKVPLFHFHDGKDPLPTYLGFNQLQHHRGEGKAGREIKLMPREHETRAWDHILGWSSSAGFSKPNGSSKNPKWHAPKSQFRVLPWTGPASDHMMVFGQISLGVKSSKKPNKTPAETAAGAHKPTVTDGTDGAFLGKPSRIAELEAASKRIAEIDAKLDLLRQQLGAMGARLYGKALREEKDLLIKNGVSKAFQEEKEPLLKGVSELRSKYYI